ncbi:MAG TPA: hypothetical protein VK867_02255, partial [Candidatus Limnocylindrales bacterium]|nr:hypothetical protein [Candidatus Limnocylindrales bacterium]
VVLAVVSRSDVRASTEVIRALRADGARRVAIGGPAADAVPADLGAVRLTGAIDEAVTDLAAMIGARER